MAKIKVINNRSSQDSRVNNFNNTPSETLFSFGSFNITSNFQGRKEIDYTNKISTFSVPVSLDKLNITATESENIIKRSNNVTLNLDNSNLNKYVKFGSTTNFFESAIENIIVDYPGSLYVKSNIQSGGNTTFYDFQYNQLTNESTFKIPSEFTINKFGLVFNQGNNSIPDDNELKNINISYGDYNIWLPSNPDVNIHKIIGFTGDSQTKVYVDVKCIGNPFPFLTGLTNSGSIDIHIKPNTRIFEDYRIELNDYERYMLSNRNGIDGFDFIVKEPILLDDGNVDYNDRIVTWTTDDGYNIDINGTAYADFIDIITTIGEKYDDVKTNLIARMLTTDSLKRYDFSEDNKIDKLLKLYGYEFDNVKKYIDSLVNINKVTYNKKNNLPDEIVSNFAESMGWDYFELVNEEELLNNIFNYSEPERKLGTDLTPSEVDIELWRRILINTNHFWKSKGTREAIKSIFMLIGIPEPFINITEYVYTVDGKIDPRNVSVTLDDLPSASLPYNDEGYPVAPTESSSFYFQVSGDTDSGQQYMNVFRDVGFDLSMQVDNKKSWIEDGATYRMHESSPQYFQRDSKLVLNTKEVDIALDTSRGIEYDVYKYIKDFDFPANSSGYTIPYSFVNISLNVNGSNVTQFNLPDEPEGDVEIRFNGILLNPPKIADQSGTTATTNQADYEFLTPKIFQLIGGAANNIGLNNRDVVQATYLYDNGTAISQVTVKYVVARIKPNPTGTKITLPEEPKGDVQLTVNGVALTKGTSQFQADYVINENNRKELIVQNQSLITYFANTYNNNDMFTQIAYISVDGDISLSARQEIYRVDSLSTGRVYYNTNANKIVLRLNYKMNDTKSVKILINGIALEPNTDYSINSNNKYEVYLPPSINIGSVISAYYIIGDNSTFDPVIPNEFGIGDISNMSFLEFTDMVERKMVNATNRKVITNFKGGWYPTLLNIYDRYLKRSELDDSSPLKSNGYTFKNLYSFLSKYNAFFQRFVDKLLPATIIQKKGGLLVRNSIFTKQKFTYKRGVSFDQGLNYYGDDGATYLKRPLQQIIEWDDDYVCIDNLCENFVVSNVTVDYPSVTTTTTQQPFDSVLFINLLSTDQNPITDGFEITERYELDFSPDIIPNYSVYSTLNFEIRINNFDDGFNIFNSTAEINVYKNGSLIRSWEENQFDDTSGVIITQETLPIIVNSGDYFVVELYCSATAISPSTADVSVRMIPSIDNVTPNGNIQTIIPEEIITEINA